MLAGGHLPVCSSMNLDACQPDQRDDLERQWRHAEALFDRDYRPNRFARLSRDELQGFAAAQLSRLQALMASLPERAHRRQEIELALQNAGLTLTEDEQLLLFDALAAPSWRADGVTARQEQLAVQASAPAVRAVFDRFLQEAKAGRKHAPRIGILTSAARDAQDAAAFYLPLFRQLGAEPIWLPLDPASRTLRDDGRSFDSAVQACAALLQERQRQSGLPVRHQIEAGLQQHYCTRTDLVSVIATLDGVFFNGGDQSLHLKSLLRADGSDSPELAALRARHERGELVIMGTSAGTAVQTGDASASVPMISNGATANALTKRALAQTPRLPFCEQRQDCPPAWEPEQLTYRPQGGLRLFAHGILDTHFSERARQGRLLMLLGDTGQLRGFGVDEMTALVVRQHDGRTDFDVVGRAGVWLAEQVQRKGIELSARVHYLRTGDRAVLRQQRLQVEPGQCAPRRQYKLAALDTNRLITANGVNEAALHLQLTDARELAVLDDAQQWTFARGKQFALCPKADGDWSYRDLELRLKTPARPE